MTAFRTSHPNVPSLARSASLARVLRLGVLALGALPAAFTSPVRSRSLPAQSPPFGLFNSAPHDPDVPREASTLAYLTTAIILVLLGGAFAGLTIALMGQDEINLQVIAESGEKHEKHQATRVLRLLRKGKHWVLVTLLLSNVITNETLPIVLDRSLGGGWPAVVASTVLIVIFGEIVPQSICVRYGLPIGAMMSPCVLALMWIMSPVAWPIAKLLDYLLGKDHGTTYKKAGLKTLVTLHRTLGTDATQRLNSDEVTIISSVLDLKDKPVVQIMTPIKDVFILPADALLDEKMVATILSQGFSRVPIHQPGNPTDFVGMLLVKTLIMYEPKDKLRVQDFTLATLPETRPETSCLDIVNFFQEGKSHMALVSEYPGTDHGALGVVTLEDVIEELIGEEIIDESDVFVDVHKAIRRWAPGPLNGPLMTRHLSMSLSDTDGSATPTERRSRSQVRTGPYYLRRSETGPDTVLPPDARETSHQLPSLGPSNKALDPRSTQIPSITIKSLTRAGQDGTGHSVPDVPTDASLLLHNHTLTTPDGYGTMERRHSLSIVPGLDKKNGTAHSRNSSSSAGSSVGSRAPKLIIPSERPPSAMGDHSSPSREDRSDGSRSGTIVQTSSPHGSHSTTVAVSGQIQETTVASKLVITSIPRDESRHGGNGSANTPATVVASTTTTTTNVGSASRPTSPAHPPSPTNRTNFTRQTSDDGQPDGADADGTKSGGDKGTAGKSESVVVKPKPKKGHGRKRRGRAGPGRAAS